MLNMEKLFAILIVLLVALVVLKFANAVRFELNAEPHINITESRKEVSVRMLSVQPKTEHLRVEKPKPKENALSMRMQYKEWLINCKEVDRVLRTLNA
jgi:hypothetical protein